MKLNSTFIYISLFAFSINLVAQDSIQKPKRFTLHVQETTVSQYRPSFNAQYTGAHSQVPVNEWGTTITSTIFAGMRLWKNAQIFINPEIASGHGLSTAFGIAAFSNGEAFRVGSPEPTIYLARGYFRQLIPLNKNRELQDDGENKLQQLIPTNYLVVPQIIPIYSYD